MELMAMMMPVITAHIAPKMVKFLGVAKGSSLRTA